jgi:hypothetical protein
LIPVAAGNNKTMKETNMKPLTMPESHLSIYAKMCDNDDSIAGALLREVRECHRVIESKGIASIRPLEIGDGEMLFKKIRAIALSNPARSKRFKDFVKQISGKKEFHHVFGSAGNLKSTDLLGIGLDEAEHRKTQDDKAKLIEQIPAAIVNLLLYVETLENYIYTSQTKGRGHGLKYK